jgi:hypothetical protein
MWHRPVILALGRQRQEDLWSSGVQDQPQLHSERPLLIKSLIMLEFLSPVSVHMKSLFPMYIRILNIECYCATEGKTDLERHLKYSANCF